MSLTERYTGARTFIGVSVLAAIFCLAAAMPARADVVDFEDGIEWAAIGSH